jgi:hypothetical protein
VRAFVDAHPVTGALSYASAQEMLDEVVQRLRGYAGAQVSGRELGRGEVLRQQDQIALLIDRHMRPIVTIARAQILPGSDVGLPGALRMPKLPLGATKAIAACDGMIQAARQFEAVFVANGLAADFLAEFQSARDALERIMTVRATLLGTRVAARAGLRAELVRGRRAVERLDAIVRGSFRGDYMTLSAWRGAKRVHLVSGGAGSRAEGGVTEGVAEDGVTKAAA